MTIAASMLEGYLESPGAWHPATGSLHVLGWVFGRDTPVRGVEIAIDGAAPVALAYGVVRPDVQRRYAVPGSLASGFGALIPLPTPDIEAVRVVFHVILEDDRRVRWLERHVRLYQAGQVAGLRRVLTTVGAVATAAIRERRLPPAPTTWLATLRRHWEGFADLQPPRHTTPQPFERDRLEASYRRFRQHVASRDQSAPLPHRDLAATVVLIARPGDLTVLDRLLTMPMGTRDEVWIVVAGGSPTADEVADLARRRDRQVSVAQVSDLSDACGRWLPPGAAPHVVLLDGHAVPAAGGIDRVLSALEESGADWVFSDDDQSPPGAEARDPYLKGAFSPESALTDDYATRLTAVRRSAIAAAGGLQASAGESQLPDLLLRLWSQGAQCHHLPVVCCHRRADVPLTPAQSHLDVSAAWLTTVSNLPVSFVTDDTAAGRAPRVRWSASACNQEVTVVIPTRDRVELLRACVESLTRTVDRARTEVLIVDDGSSREETRDYLLALPKSDELRCRVLRASDGRAPFNYARLMNAGAASVSTPLMLHLNNDIEAIVPGWLEQMVGWFSCPGIGVVGAKLIYRDGSIQHAGVFVSPRQSTPHHCFRRMDGKDGGYQWLPHRLRNVSAVTGACLLTSQRLFQESGGFNAERLAVQFNDVDYCLRLLARGLRVVYEPAAVLYHDESASRGRVFDYRENAYFQDVYRGYRDPYVSVHIDAESFCGPTPVVMSPTRAR